MDQTAIHVRDGADVRAMEAPVASAIDDLAHELANPLNAIAITTELAKRMLARGQKDNALSALNNIGADCERCARLLRDAQEFLSLDVRRPHETVDLPALLNDLAEPLQERGEVRVHAPSGDCRIEGNLHALRRLFREVLRNAFDHGACHAEVDLRRDAQTVWVRIGDDGPGIDPAIRARVFDAFFSTCRQRHSGTGLAIARLIARAHAGEIRVEDAQPGAAFRVMLSVS